MTVKPINALTQSDLKELGQIIANEYDYDTFDEYIADLDINNIFDDCGGMATGICRNPDCHAISEETIEPDATDNWCAVCNENSVMSVNELLLRYV